MVLTVAENKHQLRETKFESLISSIQQVIYLCWSNIYIYICFCDRVSWVNFEVREKTNKMQQLDVYYQHFLNMFWAPLCPSSGDQDLCRTLTFTVLTPYNAAPHNRYQPHPAEPAQHTTCSNTRSLFPWRWA